MGSRRPGRCREITMLMIAIISLVWATLFTGAAGYVTLVEHPARLELAEAPLLAQWKPSYDRALPIQSGLAVAGGVAGIGAWYLSGNLLWGVGSLTLLANWPFTLFAIMPINRQLKAIRTDQDGPKSRALLLSWGKMHNVRSALGAASMMVFASALATSA